MNFVIGNIEGRFEVFQTLLEHAKFNPNCDKLYILGDFVGNTFSTIPLIEHIIYNSRIGSYFPILGDREEMFVEALLHGNMEIEEKLLAEKGLIYSYYDNQKIKRSHLKFFESLPKQIETEKFIFSHIGKIFFDGLIINSIESKPHVEKTNKLHFYSHYLVNDFCPQNYVYVDRETNSICINKNVCDVDQGGLLLLNLDTNKVYIAKDVVV